MGRRTGALVEKPTIMQLTKDQIGQANGSLDRHEADYDHTAVFTKPEVIATVDLAADTLALIRDLRPQRRLIDYAFLISLLLQR